MNRGAPTHFDAQIEACIANSSAAGFAAVAAPCHSPVECQYIIKYTSAKFGGTYPPSPNATSSPGLYVSPNPGFTWGDGIYACPVAYPISGAIYGRCGIVAALPPTDDWRIFDATNTLNAGLYVQWIQLQPIYPMLTLTAHSLLANQLLRNLFRTRFKIDVVVFRPDEFHTSYTQMASDRWLAITEWTPTGLIASGVSARRPVDPRLTVVLAEEFEIDNPGIRRRALIGPSPSIGSMLPSAGDVINAYTNLNLLWVGA